MLPLFTGRDYKSLDLKWIFSLLYLISVFQNTYLQSVTEKIPGSFNPLKGVSKIDVDGKL